MFTCIIPTIEKSDKWEKQIPFLVEHNKVDEIIIIKDLPKPEISAYYEFDKIKLFYTGGGCFCNGSWNKGIELAKNAENIIFSLEDKGEKSNLTLEELNTFIEANVIDTNVIDI
jgi:hypothetical protein